MGSSVAPCPDSLCAFPGAHLRQPSLLVPSPASVPAATDSDEQERPEFSIDLEDLQQIASKKVLWRGIAYFREDRVTELSWGETWAEAQVEGSRPRLPYQVRIDLEDGEIGVECDCPFDGEPVWARMEERARLERQVAGAEHVKVRHVAGDRWFGT